ncbi:alpha-N-acetylglucosaminidase TIM-barrel domain-containing protein [Bacteroides sp.]
MKSFFLTCFSIVWVFFLGACTGTSGSADIITPAKQVIERQIGDKVNGISFQQIEPVDGKETFEIEAKDGKLTLKGSSTVAICYAFHTYQREACQAMKTWSGEHAEYPSSWPDYSLKKQTTPYDYRYFLNVCTYGYTTPYWDWKRWEKEIDWMALRGVNMPLATVASEAIAERVWLQMGLTKEETREFFTGPAHLPWHRMGNLNTWDGPLSDEWQESQIQLQHQIIHRMRELGMDPIAPAFAGFVPMAFAEKHPDVKFKHLKWGGFDDKFNAYVLPPDSPFFEEIGKRFIKEWEKEFGKNTYYLSDSFNEMELPVAKEDVEGKHKLLAQYGESIYQSIAAGNPDAVWVTQGWTFGYQHTFWDKASLQALLSRVPDDKMIIVDLGNDYPKWVWDTEQTWKVHDGFYGKKWIFSYVPNFGGKTPMTGDLQMYASSSAEALHSQSHGNLIGFGSAPEGLENNEVVYELLADMGWTDQAIDLDKWMPSYCTARYGAYPEAMKEAWDLFRKTAYSSLYSYPRFTWQTVVPDQRRISKIDVSNDFLHAVELFLSCADSLSNSQLYVNDAIEFASYYVAAKADKFYTKALAEDAAGRPVVAQRYLNQAIGMLLNVDKLLASHPLYRLEEWVSLARNCGTTPTEKDAYEANAKRLITTWGGFQEDYAARFWSGLIKDYYIPRLEIYFSERRDRLECWEEEWIDTPWSNTTTPFEDPLHAAIELVQKIEEIKI